MSTSARVEAVPFNHFKPPISRGFLKMSVPLMKTPRFIYKDKAIEAKRYEIKSYDGEMIECFCFSPKGLNGNAPCLVYIHGGGFVLPAADKNCKFCE